jgi:hypothetical protein
MRAAFIIGERFGAEDETDDDEQRIPLQPRQPPTPPQLLQLIARWEGTAVTWGEEGNRTGRDKTAEGTRNGVDVEWRAEWRRARCVVARREGCDNEEVVVGGGEVEVGYNGQDNAAAGAVA